MPTPGSSYMAGLSHMELSLKSALHAINSQINTFGDWMCIFQRWIGGWEDIKFYATACSMSHNFFFYKMSIDDDAVFILSYQKGRHTMDGSDLNCNTLAGKFVP